MTFDWRGTFNKSQFDRFAAFARAQVPSINARYRHLVWEQERVGSLTFTYDKNGTPISFTASDSTTTYIGKLVAAYEALGGQVRYDLQVRTLNQAVYLLAGSETRAAQTMSNGEVVGTKGLADATTALLVQQARAWLEGDLRQRREYLEHKIRRALDYADQLQQDIKQLQQVAKGVEVDGSLENIFAEVTQLISDTQYRAVYDDKGTDPDGKLTYSPFATYSTTDADPAYVPDEAGGPVRDLDGAHPAGEVG
jgi:hypothetical protein